MSSQIRTRLEITNTNNKYTGANQMTILLEALLQIGGAAVLAVVAGALVWSFMKGP